MLAPEILRHAHNAVCAIGLLPVPLEEWNLQPSEVPLQIEGTGFLVRPNTVMTNQHVLEKVVLEAHIRDIPDTQLFVWFVAPSRIPKVPGTLRMIRQTHTQELGEVDVALLEIRADPDFHFEDMSPLIPADSPEVQVSEEVFLCGFPYTNLLLEHEGRPTRSGPVVQQGFVSGLAPFEGAEAPADVLLDVRTAEGMSGSPVVRSATGELIGIHYEAIEDKTAITTTTFAIPVHNEMLVQWLREFDEVLNDA